MEYLMNAITWFINFIIYLFGLAINFVFSLLKRIDLFFIV